MKITGVLTLCLAVATPADALLGRFFQKSETPAKTSAPAPAAATGLKLPPKGLDNKGLDYLFTKNKVWQQDRLKEDKKFFEKLGKTHTPDYMYIGCVDARVPENLIMGEPAGNIFVHRNVANMVVNTDMNLLSALQYGVAYLKVKDIIVCGHYECGGMKAAENQNDHGAPLETWLRNARDVYSLHKDELNAIEDPNARHRRFVELNVIQQCINLFKTGVVQKTRKDNMLEGKPVYPRVHAMVFDPNSGDLKRIPFDFSEVAKDLADIYGLYVVEEKA